MTTDSTDKSLKLTSIEGVASLIEKLATKPKDAPSPLMKAAYEAVIDLIETHGGWDAGISRALDKVRLAYGLEKPKPKLEVNDDEPSGLSA